ncbi:MAG TPA: excisionase family DNA-binding protein [Blastocatellia bacterium]|nr:excisionase family DNA-binding protein [Blastocatellia bacterium]
MPSINFANRANLPTCCSAVYLAFNANGNCLYIGKAQDIRKRFINHKLVRLLDSIGDITLRWLHIPVGQLDRVERNLIFHFCPPLNIHHSPDATEKIKSSRRNIERPASDLDSDNPSITTKEAAEELGVTIGRVRQLVLDGTIKAERFGRALVISKAEIEKAKKRPDNRGRPAKRAKG